VQNATVFQHLFRDDPGTDFPEINQRIFGHKMTPFNVLFDGNETGESGFAPHANMNSESEPVDAKTRQ
jgi:hypothetical protein